MDDTLTQPWFPEVPLRLRAIEDIFSVGEGGPKLEKKIDREMDGLEEALRQLRATRNACQPPLRLPPEVLGEISDILAVIWPAQCGYPPTFLQVDTFDIERGESRLRLGWVLLGHICGKLRNVLLSRAHLWADNICAITRTFEDAISYCRELPLSIHMGLWGCTLNPLRPGTTFVARHMARSRSLSIQETVQNSLQETLLSKLDAGLFSRTSFPFLEHLTLCRHHSLSSPMSARRVSPEIHELPSVNAPRLSSIYLQNFLISIPPSNLTYLRLDFSDTVERPYTSTQLFDMLKQCQKVRQLRTTACIPDDFNAKDIASISLPALEILWARDNIVRLFGLCHRIHMPNLISLKCELLDVDDTMQGLVTPINTIVPLLRAPHIDTSVMGLSLGEDSIQSVVVVGLVAPGTSPYAEEYEWKGPFAYGYRERLLVTFEQAACHPPHLTNNIATLASSVNCGAIKILDLKISAHYEIAAWKTHFQSFLNVTTLYLDEMPVRTALLALLVPASAEEVISLPQLRFLWVATLDLQVPNEHDEASDTPGAHDRLQFIRIISSRRRARIPLEHLRVDVLLMDPAQATREFVPRLEALVPLVEIGRTVARLPDTDDEEGDGQED